MSIRRVEKIDDIVQVRHVFMSVADKTNLETLVPSLIDNCPEVVIYSTGGTYKKIAGILDDMVEDENTNHNPNLKNHVLEVSEYTGLPETEGGLVKSLHHKLFLGYLTEAYSEAHQRDLEREDAVPIDLTIQNMYPFEDVVAKEGIDIEEARGNIDVGGPSALRAASKNWHRVAVVTDPNDYKRLIEELETNNGCTTLRTRFELHKKAFRFLANYNKAIADFVEEVPFKEAIKTYEIVRGN
tara:strand:- start:769 stop:1491 length:723 start_codon:yes stop_codon:yes gene_type:complete